MKQPKYTLTALIEQLYEKQITSLQRAANSMGDGNRDMRSWEKGEACAYADAREMLKRLRSQGRTRIV
jgi:hypothetical protein